MNNTLNNFRIHRHYDRAAISLNTGQTLYLSASGARELAKYLLACADDIDTHTFIGSPFTTAFVDVSE